MSTFEKVSEVIATIFIITLITLIAVMVYYSYNRPLVQYKCLVYHIYGEKEIRRVVQKDTPRQPRFGKNYGWISDFDDPTICHYQLLTTDTLKNEN